MRPDLRKIWVVASTEFGSSIRTKSFIIGLLLLPIIMGLSIVLQLFVAKRVDTRTRTFAVVDRTGRALSGDRAGGRGVQRPGRSTPQGKAVRPRLEPRRSRPEPAESIPPWSWSSPTGSAAASSTPSW